MTIKEVLVLLETNQKKENIEKWKQKTSASKKYRSYGIGLTVLRKLAKKIGRDHSLAKELWESDIYDAKIISLLIDDPKLITREQVEIQVEDLKQGHLAHVFSSCDATLGKAPFVVDLMVDWMDSKDEMRRSCAYGLLYEISKSKKKSAPDNAFYLERIDVIRKTFDDEHIKVQGSMGGALLGIGKRNKVLNAEALELARSIGPIQFESNNRDCEPFNVVKHLTSDYIKDKLGI